MLPGTVLVVGAGLAGARAAETLRAEGYDGRLIVVGDEASAPYERPALSKEYLAGTKSEQQLRLRPPEFWVDAGDRAEARAPRRPHRSGPPDGDPLLGRGAHLGRPGARDRSAAAQPAVRGARRRSHAPHPRRRQGAPGLARRGSPPRRRRRRLHRRGGRLDGGRTRPRRDADRGAPVPFERTLEGAVGPARGSLPLLRRRPSPRHRGRRIPRWERQPGRVAPARRRLRASSGRRLGRGRGRLVSSSRGARRPGSTQRGTSSARATGRLRHTTEPQPPAQCSAFRRRLPSRARLLVQSRFRPRLQLVGTPGPASSQSRGRDSSCGALWRTRQPTERRCSPTDPQRSPRSGAHSSARNCRWQRERPAAQPVCSCGKSFGCGASVPVGGAGSRPRPRRGSARSPRRHAGSARRSRPGRGERPSFLGVDADRSFRHGRVAEEDALDLVGQAGVVELLGLAGMEQVEHSLRVADRLERLRAAPAGEQVLQCLTRAESWSRRRRPSSGSNTYAASAPVTAPTTRPCRRARSSRIRRRTIPVNATRESTMSTVIRRLRLTVQRFGNPAPVASFARSSNLCVDNFTTS